MRALEAGSKRTRHCFSSVSNEPGQQRANRAGGATTLNDANHVGYGYTSARFPAVKMNVAAVDTGQ
jgi:hypothetical protein